MQIYISGLKFRNNSDSKKEEIYPFFLPPLQHLGIPGANSSSILRDFSVGLVKIAKWVGVFFIPQCQRKQNYVFHMTAFCKALPAWKKNSVEKKIVLVQKKKFILFHFAKKLREKILLNSLCSIAKQGKRMGSILTWTKQNCFFNLPCFWKWTWNEGFQFLRTPP